MTTIKQILEWPVGYKSGGFDLITKTVKKKTDLNERAQLQRLRLMDTSGDGDILAEMRIRRNFTITPNTRIHIKVAKRGELDLNSRMVPALIIDEWYLDLPKTTSDEFSNGPDMLEAWREDIGIVKGKVRHGIVCAMIKRLPSGGRLNLFLTKEQKESIAELVEFIMTGE